jgi:hypothetical protein
MEEVQIQAALRRAEATALREMLDRHLATIQYLENSQPQNLPEEIEQERHAVVLLIMAIENALRRTPVQ